MNQEPLTPSLQLIFQKDGHTEIVGSFCNFDIALPVLRSDGRCFEGVHARDVDFLRDHNRRPLRCIACCNGCPWLPGARKRSRPSEISGVLFNRLNPDRRRGLIAR